MYPFASEIEGRFVRGQRSYTEAVDYALKKYGPGRIGFKLVCYRGTFHFVGSILFIILATFITKTLFDSDTALYVLLFTAIISFSYQEFYLHPKRYGQHANKGITDWLTWVVPMLMYVTLFVI